MTVAEKLKHIFKSFYNRIIGKRQDPIFIVGTGRCGSTLLVDILMTNPDIQIDQNEQYDWFLPEANVKGKKHNPIYSDIVNFEITVKKSLEKWTPFYKSKLRIMMDTKMNKTNRRFFFKSPAITFMLPEIEKLYPKAKYIHLYRNGFAVARSWFKKEYFRVQEYQDNFTEDEFIIECAKYYNASILAINDFFKDLTEDQKFEISYEKLAESPEEEIGKLLKFSNVKSNCNFDFSQVKSTNFKIEKIEEPLKSNLETIMHKSLKSLDYI